MAIKAIAQGIFTEGPNPQLIAGRCSNCEVVTFPRQGGCPRCTGRDIADHLLPTVGELWSWTVQRFEPKTPYRGPAEFTPYGVGYIEFPGECIVEARLTTADPAALRIGAPMRLTFVENHRDESGDAVHVYAFEPEGDHA
jgi:uncharacterized OB-fold protein